MARNESVAVAGYFPTPSTVLGKMRGCITYQSDVPDYLKSCRIFDPCAGEAQVMGAFPSMNGGSLIYHVAEMEKNRYLACVSKIAPTNGVSYYGDFLCSTVNEPFANVLWLNPPYDYDKKYVRLEERFLQKALPSLMMGGTLFFLVPIYALHASAETLGKNFKNLRFWRFPGDSYEDYLQVIVVGEKTVLDPDGPEGVLAVARFDVDVDDLPDSLAEPIVVRATTNKHPWRCLTFKSIREEDLPASFSPWVSKNQVVTAMVPPEDILATFKKVFDVANPPREAHVVSALSIGVLNGVEIVPDDPTSGLPNLLLKGKTTREKVLAETKKNKDGEDIAEVYIERAAVEVHALRLDDGTYTRVPSSGPIKVLDWTLEGINMASLIDSYGKSLMGEMLKSCPSLHDRRRDPEFEVSLGRPLFPAQQSAVNTLEKLRVIRKAPGAILLGEVGSGKTCVSAAFAKKMEAKRTLVMCPPHLLQSWGREVKEVLPGYDVINIESISDAQKFSQHPGPVFGILSREKAKLGSTHEGVIGSCPKCGTILKMDPADLARSRARCVARLKLGDNPIGAWVRQHAHEVAVLCPDHPYSYAVRSARSPALESSEVEITRPLFKSMAGIAMLDYEMCVLLSWTYPEMSMPLFRAWTQKPDVTDDDVLSLASLVVDQEAVRLEVEEVFSKPNRNRRWMSAVEVATVSSLKGYKTLYGSTDVQLVDGTLSGGQRNSRYSAQTLMRYVLSKAGWDDLSMCGEPLYQTSPEPRRYPIASWISKYAKDSYDLLILDEAHELATHGSAQTAARTRLQAGKAFVLSMTGSLVNGYAESAFENMLSSSRPFANAYGRDGRQKFIDHYGFRKFIVDLTDKDGKVVKGAHTDRILGKTKKAGIIPGVHPSFSMEWQLSCSVTLQKADLDVHIHPVTYETKSVSMTHEQARQCTILKDALFERIKQDKHNPLLAGRLWGAVNRLSSFPDLCCSGPFEIRYPETVGGDIVVAVPGIDPDVILPKEKILLDAIEEQLSQGRRVMVLVWHKEVTRRIANLLLRERVSYEILESDTVPTGKREAWITNHVVKKNVQVLLTNPMVVQTGLNNLVHFATQLWYENPACNPTILRQAIGRIDRIGQKMSPLVIFLTYSEDVQDKPRILLMSKVGVSRTIDGLDPEGVLAEAGVDVSLLAGMSIGKQLFRLMSGES